MLIVLDLDDTLYLERDYARSGFAAVERCLGLESPALAPGFAAAAWEVFESGGRDYIFNRVLGGRGCDDASLVARLVEVYRAHRPAIGLLPDARAFLAAAAGHELVLLTDGPVISQSAKIEALGIAPMLARMVLTDGWGLAYRKPHPRAYLEIAADRNPAQCLAIGDNPAKDFSVPLALGWRSPIRVRRAGALHTAVATPEGCMEVTSLADVDLKDVPWSMK